MLLSLKSPVDPNTFPRYRDILAQAALSGIWWRSQGEVTSVIPTGEDSDLYDRVNIWLVEQFIVH
jgi:hypothetical protein